MDATLDLKNVTPQLIAALYVEMVKHGLVEIGIQAKTDDLNVAGKKAQTIEEQADAVAPDAKVKKLDSKKEKSTEKASTKKSAKSESKSGSKVSEDTESEEDEDGEDEEEDPKPSKKSSKTPKQPSKAGGGKSGSKSSKPVESPDEDEEEDGDEEEEGDEDEPEVIEVPEKYNQESIRKLAATLSQLGHADITDKALEYFEEETIPDLNKSDYEKFYKYVIKKYKKATAED